MANKFLNPRQQLTCEEFKMIGFEFLFQSLTSINHHHLSHNWMKYQGKDPTWKIHACYGKFGEISIKFGLSGVCVAPHTQRTASCQCSGPIQNYTAQLLPVRRASLVRRAFCPMRRASQISSNFTQIAQELNQFSLSGFLLGLGIQMTLIFMKICL